VYAELAVSAASVAAVYDWANGLGFAGRLKFSEVDPLLADTVELVLGEKLFDGVLAGLGGGVGFALEVASEVIAGASGVKLGAAWGCFALSSGFANENGLVSLAGWVSGAFDAAKEKVGNFGLSLGGPVGEGMAGKSSIWGELVGEESLTSSINGIGGPAGFGGWLNRESGALCFGWLNGEAVVVGLACSVTLFVVAVKLNPPNPGPELSFFAAKRDSPGALGARVSLFGWLNPENAFDVELGVELKVDCATGATWLPPKKLNGVDLGAVDVPNGAPAASPPLEANPKLPGEGLPNDDVSVFVCCVGCPNTDVGGVSKSTPNGEPLDFGLAMSGMKSDSPSLTISSLPWSLL
jgi:hypothetical protein